jgi:hypothetical protein
LVELTNDQFDEVEIRKVSFFWRGVDEIGMPAVLLGVNTGPAHTSASSTKNTWWTFVPTVIEDRL